MNQKIAILIRLANWILDSEHEDLSDLSNGTSRSMQDFNLVPAFKEIFKSLTDLEKEYFLAVIKSGIILTSGNNQMLRNPEGFSHFGYDTFNDITEESVNSFLVKQLGYPKDWSYHLITKKDYQLAKKLLPFFGSYKITPKIAKQLTDQYGVFDKFDASKVSASSKLYRGLHDLSKNLFLSLTKEGRIWNTLRAVSTSRFRPAAVKFASTQKNSNNILLEINNPEQIGLSFSGLSSFRSEREVILSAALEVKSWYVEAKAIGTHNDRIFNLTITKDSVKINNKEVPGDIDPLAMLKSISFDEKRKGYPNVWLASKWGLESFVGKNDTLKTTEILMYVQCDVMKTFKADQ